MSPDLWFYRPIVRPSARGRMICFPYAGGSPTIFTRWAAKLPSGIELLAVRLPGRDRHFRISAISDWPTLLNSIRAVLTAHFDLPFALFGHSLGASIAYEIASMLDQESGPQTRLTHLIVSARCPPDSPAGRPPLHDLPRQEFFARLRELNGIPPEVFACEALMLLVEPTLRADVKLAETWEPARRSPLRVPVTALAATSDELAPHSLVSDWGRYTTGAFRFHTFAGNHFFLHSAEDEILGALEGIWETLGL